MPVPSVTVYVPWADWRGKLTWNVWVSIWVMVNVDGSSGPPGAATMIWLAVKVLALIFLLKPTWKEETFWVRAPVGVKLATAGGMVSWSITVKLRLAER